MKQVLGLASILAAAAVMTAAFEVRADEVVRYTVKKGDSCASIARHFYGDSRYAELLHEANDIQGPQPHALEAGRVLVIPPKPTAPTGPDAKLTAVRNHVEIQTPQTKPGRVNDPLYRGNRVATEAVSAAAVTFRDETQVRLGERTLVVILGDANRAASLRPTVETNLVTGNLRAWMSKSPVNRVAVATEAAQVRMIGGEAAVSSDEKKTTRLAVYAGNSKITAARKTEDVSAGYGTKAERGKVPEVPKPLPHAPTWTSGVPQVLVDRGTGAPPFVAEFGMPDGADAAKAHVGSWHVQIARDAAFDDIVVDHVVPRETQRVEASSPSPGRYFVRVSAIDEDRFEGPYGRPLPFGMVKLDAQPTSNGRRVTLEASNVTCVRVGNVNLQAVRSSIDLRKGERMLVRCAVSDTEPTTLIDVDADANVSHAGGES
ncbi:LysM domain protein [Labilithrix luteola]|uniref:LysM domain protein n=1 Tax=Labilithrix luteola TaxID=1391654 RepID=A0A0K1PLX9_9BACT|nr:FecR domain-containing protein [Labilithrix luteola]AKU94527.1 LysM domain protein [Labilithrix luteola]